MTDTIKAQGRCLCGAVKIQVEELAENVGACHCRMCRTWGGGPLMAVDAGQEVSIQGQDKLSIYASSEWAERGFCSQCGSHLFYRLKQMGKYIVPAGLFSDVDFVFDHQVFIDQKPSYYAFKNSTQDMTEEEVFAHFASLSGDA